jgi:hypothetical protein
VLSANMKRIRSSMFSQRTILRVVVEKHTGTAPIMRFNIERKTITTLKDHTGRPDLNIDWNDLTWSHLLNLVMAVIRSILR